MGEISTTEEVTKANWRYRNDISFDKPFDVEDGATYTLYGYYDNFKKTENNKGGINMSWHFHKKG